MQKMKTQIGVLSKADLEDGTLTFEVDVKTMAARAGKYAIVPIEEYEKLANEANTSANKALNIDLVSGCSLEEMQSLRKIYKERIEMCARNDNYREAHEENIRLGVMDLLISKSNNR